MSAYYIVTVTVLLLVMIDWSPTGLHNTSQWYLGSLATTFFCQKQFHCKKDENHVQ